MKLPGTLFIPQCACGCRRTSLYLLRDVPGCFDTFNTSTALHRIAKLSKWQRVRMRPRLRDAHCPSAYA